MFKTEWSTDLDEEWSFPTFLYNSMLNSTRVLTKDKRDLTISSQSKARFEIWNWLVKLCFFFLFCIPNLITILFVFGLSFLSNKLRHITRDLGFTPPSSYSESIICWYNCPFSISFTAGFPCRINAKDMGGFPWQGNKTIFFNSAMKAVLHGNSPCKM